MFFAWIDRHRQLDAERFVVARGDPVAPFHLATQELGPAVVGWARYGVFPTTVRHDPQTWVCVWGCLLYTSPSPRDS